MCKLNDQIDEIVLKAMDDPIKWTRFCDTTSHVGRRSDATSFDNIVSALHRSGIYLAPKPTSLADIEETVKWCKNMASWSIKRLIKAGLIIDNGPDKWRKLSPIEQLAMAASGKRKKKRAPR